MDPVIDVLVRLIENPDAFKGTKPAAPREISADVSAAPASVQRLAAAMASRYYNVKLGAFRMFDNRDHSRVDSLDGTISMACEKAAENGDLDLAAVLAAALPDGFDPARTLQLGGDGGGMSYFGIHWADGQTSFIVVEFEDPTEQNLIAVFSTPAAFLAFLDDKRDADDESPADLEALRAAAG